MKTTNRKLVESGKLLLGGLLLMVLVCSCESEPDKELTKKLIWEIELEEQVKSGLENDLSDAKDQLQADYDYEQSHMNEMEAFIRDGINGMTGTDNGQDNVDSKQAAFDRIYESLYPQVTPMIDNWDFSTPEAKYDGDVYARVYEKGDTAAALKNYIQSHMTKAPELSKFTKVQKGIWVVQDLTHSTNFLIKKKNDGLEVQVYSGTIQTSSSIF